MLICVYTCQNASLLGITCCGSNHVSAEQGLNVAIMNPLNIHSI